MVDVELMLMQCWASVADEGTTIHQHLFNGNRVFWVVAKGDAVSRGVAGILNFTPIKHL